MQMDLLAPLEAEKTARLSSDRAAAYKARLDALFDEGAVHSTSGFERFGRPYWKTNAYDHSGEILAYPDRPKPVEATIRGMRCIIAFEYGFSTHAVDRPGTLFWSETGYQSWAASNDVETAEQAIPIIEAFIDAKPHNGYGLGGKLKTWWSWEIRHLQDYRERVVNGYCLREGDAERIPTIEAAIIAQGFDIDAVAPWPEVKAVIKAAKP